MTEGYTTLQRNLERKMKEGGFSALSLSKKAGLGETAVKAILYGRSVSPRYDTLKKLAHVLHCRIEDLTGDRGLAEESASFNHAQLPKLRERHPDNIPDFDKKMYQEVNAIALDVISSKKNLDTEEMFNFIRRLYELAVKKGRPPARETVEWIFEDTFETKIF